LRVRNLRRTWSRLGDVRALLAGGAVLGGATALGATQAAMISLMAYRLFARPPEQPNPNAEKAFAIAHRLAKHLLLRSGRSITAVTAAEMAASIYMGLRTVRKVLAERRTVPLLPPPSPPIPEEEP
jgi:hypothetical protein